MAESPARITWLGSLFSELRRRRVLRSSAIYVAVSWLLIQVADTTFPIFDLPETYTRFVTLALIAGFPVVVILSWVFDIVPSSASRILDTVKVPDASAAIMEDAGSYTLSESAAPARSIAVMPFANLSKDPDSEFFSDGISEELLNLLNKVVNLKVAARTSSFAFRDTHTDARAVARRLGVRHLLDGSVRHAGDRVRISAQLIDADTGYTLWSSSFDRSLHDIFAVQDEIASCIVYALEVALEETHGGKTPLRESAPTQNIEAYQMYLRGLYLWQRRGATAIKGAIDALTAATDADPEFAEATTLLAMAHAALHEYSGEDRESGFAIAEPLARRAMTLNPKLGKPHAVLGYMGMRLWDWSASAKHFRLALALEDSDPIIHLWYSNLLNDLGYREKALSHALTAYQLDRLSPQANNVLALNFVLLGRDEAARKHIAVAREFGLGGSVPDYVDFFVRLRKGEFEDAIAGMTALLGRRGQDTSWIAPTVAAIENPDKIDAARTALHEARENKTITPALAHMQYILLHQSDEIFELAEEQLVGHRLTHLWLLLPEAAELRHDPRFLDLMKRMGILEYWQQQGWPPVTAELNASSSGSA